MMIPRGTAFRGIRTADFPDAGDASTFLRSAYSSLEIEPAGQMSMPAHFVTNRLQGEYRIHQTMLAAADGQFPGLTPFPKMKLTVLENACCLPFAPPFLPRFGRVVTDYLLPWAPGVLGWFDRLDDHIYSLKEDIDTEGAQYEVETAFYMDHSISRHFGHFMVDCLPRLHAWDVCRALFGDVKVILAAGTPGDFREYLLNAAGVASDDIVPLTGLARCRRLVLATQSMANEHYASPMSARLWASMRDRASARDLAGPDKIYISRSGVSARGLLNEMAVESAFQRHGFTVIKPETLSPERQIALFSNALHVAGPSGSGMFNLAFQGRMRSAFVLVWEQFIRMSEMLFSAGRDVDLHYHIGGTVPSEERPRDSVPWFVDLAQLESDIADWVRGS
jgi:hypothetical protein